MKILTILLILASITLVSGALISVNNIVIKADTEKSLILKEFSISSAEVTNVGFTQTGEEIIRVAFPDKTIYTFIIDTRFKDDITIQSELEQKLTEIVNNKADSLANIKRIQGGRITIE